ncbi:MAG: DUF4251 domain-containing protein [Taibaiella sp.]|jgi:hypothetical protein
MKRQVKSVWLLLLLLMPCVLPAFQNPDVKEQPKTTLIFVPETAYPLGMRSRQVTGFELRISKDAIKSYLPYFGRAYSADYGSSNTGAEFTSFDFSYTENTNKKGVRDIVIKPRDNKDVREMRVTVYGDGYAYVQLNFNQRQSIGYRGQISEQKK